MKITIDGVTKNLFYWSLISGVSQAAIRFRLNHGVTDPIEAVFNPSRACLRVYDKASGVKLYEGITYKELAEKTGLSPKTLSCAIGRNETNYCKYKIYRDYGAGYRAYLKAKREGKIK